MPGYFLRKMWVASLAIVCLAVWLPAADAQMLILSESANTSKDADKKTVQGAMGDMFSEQYRREAEAARRAEAYRNSAEGQAFQRQMEQDQANRDAEKRLKEHEKRMKRQADCEREKRTGKMAYTFSSAC